MSDAPTIPPADDAERRADDAAQAEEERLDREMPEALTKLSPTAQRFLDEPEIDSETGDLPPES